MRITIDFETRSRIDIKKAGAFRYASDPSTEILCLCWKYPNSPKVYTWSPFRIDSDDIEILFEDIVDGAEISAHNAHFEWAMWNYCAVKKYNFPALYFEHVICTAAKANALALPRDLETCARVLGLPSQKDKEGSRIMLKMCKPTSKGTWHEDPKDFDKLIKYCQRDVIVQELLDLKLPDLSPEEYKIFQMDFQINRRGVHLDQEAIKNAIEVATSYSKELNWELSDLTSGIIQSASQNCALVEFLREHGLNIESVDKESVEKAIKETDDPLCLRILEIRKALALSSVKKLQSMQSMSMRDNKARGTLQFLGANRTGRWSAKGIQTQNLPRGSIHGEDLKKAFFLLKSDKCRSFYQEFPDVLSAISSCVRGMITPTPGFRLLSGDFSAIEARMVFWLSGHTEGLRTYREGKDIYKEMASFIFNKPYNAINKNERQLGKATVLGAGYSMGHNKFRETCSKAPYNIDLSVEEAKKAIETYRNIHSPVKAFWYDCDKAAKAAILSPGSVHRVGKIAFRLSGDFLFIQLPSKRKLAYFKPGIEVVEKDWGLIEQIYFYGVDQETKKWGKVHTYGGKLVENITQAASRDLMAFSLLNLAAKEYFAIMLVHDEIVAETINGSVEEFKRIMEIIPEWADGFPCVAEVEEMERYKK